MLFNTLPFLVFFVTFTAAYFAVPQTGRRWLLLAGSCYFYMCWRPEYLLLMAFPTVIDYVVALRLATETDPVRRWRWLLFSLVTNLGLLFFFKYFDFVAGTLADFGRLVGVPGPLPLLHLVLPVGISFYTFQTLSYTIDVYRGRLPEERSFATFALFIVFFPHLVAGPIMRAADLLPQFSRRVTWDGARVASGLSMMVWGLFKKIVIADRVALYVVPIYNDPERYPGLALALATYFFAFQIYCDFSGYSDIAIGTARVLGFDLMENFRQPYFSRSIQEFWRRWHISLSTWLKEYLYVSLGGNRGTARQTARNVMITMLLAGLWHGASWNFVLWGALHGVLILISRSRDVRSGSTGTVVNDTGPLPDYQVAGGQVADAAAREAQPEVVPRPAAGSARPDGWFRGVVGVVVTFHLVCASWVLFRARDLATAATIFARIGGSFMPPSLDPVTLAQPSTPHQFGLNVAMILVLLALDGWMKDRTLDDRLADLSSWQRLVFHLFLVFSIILLGAGTIIPFIYFQF